MWTLEDTRNSPPESFPSYTLSLLQKLQTRRPERLCGKNASVSRILHYQICVWHMDCMSQCISISWLILFYISFVFCPAGSLFKPGGEVCRYRQGAYNEAHAANGGTNGHVQPHGHPVWSLWRLCTGSKYRHWLHAHLHEEEEHLDCTKTQVSREITDEQKRNQ